MHNHPVLILWAGFAAIFLAAAVHRQPHLLLAAIPVVLIHWVLRIVGASGDFTFSESSLIGQLFGSLAVALAGILILAPRFGRKSPWLALLVAGGIVVLIGIVSALAYNFGGNESGRRGRLSLVFYLIVSIVLLAAITIAFVRSGGRCTRPGFAVRLLIWTFVLTMLGILVFGWYELRPLEARDLMEIFAVGLAFAACTCGVALPFLILLQASTSFSRSFDAWPGVSPSVQQGDPQSC